MPNVLRSSAIELSEGLPAGAVHLLRVVARLASEQNARIALVGGVVRDLALQLSLDRDLDLVVEGNVALLARRLAEALGGSVAASHVAFGTATVALPTQSVPGGIGFVDLAQARTEVYASPGALPTVTPATLEDDLQRRDFAVNAVALEIDCAALAAGRDLTVCVSLIDAYAGLDDLRAGVLRVLHDTSFRDDPTRMLRGLRLAVRLGLRFDAVARQLIEQELAAGGLTHISPDRVRNELCLVLDEPCPELVLRLADMLNITPQLLPALQFTPALAARMDVARQEIARGAPGLALGLLTYDMLPGEREHLILRYRLPKDATRLLRDVAAIQQVRPLIATPTLPTSRLDALLQQFSDAALHVVCVAEPGMVADSIRRYLVQVRAAEPFLNGRDLLALGVDSGPRVGALLAELRAAQLDGRIHTREQAEAWIKRETQESQ